MRLKRIAVLAVAVLAVFATVALAGWHNGKYTGKTKQTVTTATGKQRKGHVSFKITKDGVTLVRFEVKVKCADGSSTSWKVGRDDIAPITKHGKRGSFSQKTDTGGGTGKNIFSGSVKGKSAHGTLKRSDLEDANGNEVSGGQKCSSGKIKWSAKHK